MATSSTSNKMTLKLSRLILRFLLNITFVILVLILVIYGSRAAFDFTYQLYGPVTVDREPGRTVPIQINKENLPWTLPANLS